MPSTPGISLRGTSTTTCGTLFTLISISCRAGSNAAPPQFAPPAVPGDRIVPGAVEGGVKMPSERSDSIFLRQALRSQNVNPQASSGFTESGSSGAGLTGKGCVGDSHSPGIAPCGTGRSSIGNSGLPLVRSKTNTKPCLVFCTTAGTVPVPRLMSASSGGADTS